MAFVVLILEAILTAFENISDEDVGRGGLPPKSEGRAEVVSRRQVILPTARSSSRKYVNSTTAL